MSLRPPTTLPDGRIDAKSLDLAGLRQLLQGTGKEEHTALQVYKAIWQRGVTDFHEIGTISKRSRRDLAARAALPMLERAARLDSDDGTRKYIWRLDDDSYVESVLIPDPDHQGGPRLTLCVSSQVGCAMACTFCLTGDLGLKRHLLPSEIANQLLQVRQDLDPGARITNVVMMGMGEPLHNLDNLLVALENMTHDQALNLSHRKLTVSTVGLVPALRALSAATPVNIAVSLNATTEEQRRQVMPITRRWSLAELMDCCRELPVPRAKRITFEYVMMRGFNDSLDDAKRLVTLMQGVPCKINLIPYNENPEREIRRPSDLDVWRFQDHMVHHGLHTSVRRTRGRDISAACGQLGGAEHLARRLQPAPAGTPVAAAVEIPAEAPVDPSIGWRVEQLARARRGETRRLDDGKGDLLSPEPVAQSAGLDGALPSPSSPPDLP